MCRKAARGRGLLRGGKEIPVISRKKKKTVGGEGDPPQLSG